MKHSSHQIRGKCTYHFALEPGITFHHGRETTVSSQHHMAGRFCLSLAAGRGGGAGVTASPPGTRENITSLLSWTSPAKVIEGDLGDSLLRLY